MSKYQPLSDRLTASPGDEWLTSFAELESVLGFPLPKAARTGRAWWANDPEKSHSRAWADHGWEVGDVDHAAERVVFRRGAASGVALQTAADLKPLGGKADPATPKRPAKAQPEPGPQPAVEPQPAARPEPAARAQPEPPPAASAEAPASGQGGLPALRNDGPETEHSLLVRALRPAAWVSAGMFVTAAIGAFMLRGMGRRR